MVPGDHVAPPPRVPKRSFDEVGERGGVREGCEGTGERARQKISEVRRRIWEKGGLREGPRCAPASCVCGEALARERCGDVHTSRGRAGSDERQGRTEKSVDTEPCP